MCKSEITLRKFLKLLLEVEFYEITIYFTLLFIGINDFSIRDLIFYTIPIRSITNSNFTDCYLIFFLFIPFLNILIKNMSQKEHLRLMLLFILIYSVIGKIPLISMCLNYVTWFCVLYVIGSYLRLYPYHKANLNLWGKLSVIFITLSIMSVLGAMKVASILGVQISRGVAYFFIEDSNALLAVATSVCVFMYFKNLKIRRSRLINAAGGGTFGVLLIHDNLQIRPWLWTNLLNNEKVFQSGNVYQHAILSVISIFIICILIEQCRKKTIERPLIEFTYKYISRSIQIFKK